MELIKSCSRRNNCGYCEEIDIAKGLAIVLVVLGHSFPDAEIGWTLIGKDSFARFLIRWLYSFHMPLFFLFGGFLLIPRLSKTDVKTNLVKRLRRLLIPFFFFSMIYIGLKTVGAAFANHPLSSHFIVDMFVGLSPANGCWFLWVLFVMSTICIFARRLGPYGLFILSVVMYVIAIREKSWMIGKIDLVFHFFVWFAMGGIMSFYYNKLKQQLSHLIIGLIALILLTTLQLYTSYWWISLIKAFCGMIMVFCLACKISEMDNNWLHKITVLFGKYCMDIYIISMLIVVPLRILYVNFNVSSYIPYYPWVILVTCLGCVLPIIISKNLVRKNKWLSLFVIGK